MGGIGGGGEELVDPNWWSWNPADILDIVTNPFKEAIQFLIAPLNNIAEGIKAIPSTILTGLQELLKWAFVPSENYFDSQFENLKLQLSAKVSMAMPEIEDLLNLNGDGLTNITGTINGRVYTIVNFDLLNSKIPIFQGWIRGWLAIMMAFYNADQMYYLIRGSHMFLTVRQTLIPHKETL